MSAAAGTHELGWGLVNRSHSQPESALVRHGSGPANAANRLQHSQSQGSAPAGTSMLPPSVICAFLAQQRGSSDGDISDDGAHGSTRIKEIHSSKRGGGQASRQAREYAQQMQQQARKARGGGGGWRAAAGRLLRRVAVTAAAAGLVAGGAAVGRLLHASYMATLDDRDSLVARVEKLNHAVERAQARAAAAELERDSSAARARELSAALDAANARVTALTGEAAEVSRLNLNLQRRLDSLEAKVDQAAAARADAQARAAAAARGEAMWEREAGVMADRLHAMERRLATLEKK